MSEHKERERAAPAGHREQAMASAACEVPLEQLLRRVPPDARFAEEYYSPLHGTQWHPVGNYCHRAAAVLEKLRDRTHSEDFVVMFLGYLSGKLPELHRIEVPRILDAWNEFKREMGKS